MLQGGLGTLPLAPLADVPPETLLEVIRRMDARIDAETSAGEAEELWAAVYLLMGLRYAPSLARQLLQGVRNMRESATYQAILEEGAAIGEARGEARGRVEGEVRGKVEEARDVLLRLGRQRFGPATEDVRSAIETLADVDRLNRLIDRLLVVESWDELLIEP